MNPARRSREIPTYAVKEIFLTLQGEGFHTGRRAVFVRFSGCNLWTGRECGRAKAICKFCDTDFVGGSRYTVAALVAAIEEAWGAHPGGFVVFTGGEPLLQLDAQLIDALGGYEVAVETNGTQPRPERDVWLTVSPKAGAPLAVTEADELKLVYPQAGLAPDAMQGFRARHRFLQPMDSPAKAENTAAAIAYCFEHPEWRLSVQTHKLAGLR